VLCALEKLERSPLRTLPRFPLRLAGESGGAEPEDSEIVRALRAGETWAAAAAWNRHAPMVYRFLDRALGSAHDSEDLTQEVFWRVFAAIRGLRDPAAFRSFIYSAAVRMLRWHLRSRRVRRFLMLSPSGELPDHPARGEDSEGRELLQRFYRMLDELAANDRTAYVLRHVEGLKLEEIAEVTASSLATVKRRIRRASERVAVLVKADADLAHYFVSGEGNHGS
jgi:RNA polymerase sigma-70 factor (ECF subfamily)